MRSHLKSIAKRKVSDFLLREEGMVGNRSAFATAALVSTTALAATMLVVPNAEAQACGPNLVCVPGQKCCMKWIPQVMHYACVPWNGNCP